MQTAAYSFRYHLFVVLSFLHLPFLSISQTSTIPKPEEVIGFEVGADFHLATYEQSISYFEKLASERI